MQFANTSPGFRGANTSLDQRSAGTYNQTMRLAALLLAACAPHAATGPADPCLLAGIDVDALEQAAANLVLRRALVCNDHRHGRITDEDYKLQVAVLDGELKGKRIGKRTKQPVVSDEIIVWASTVVDFSTQYSEDAWSANQVLGPPDVWPGYGDNNKAWASQGADDREEWIEVGFDAAERVSGVEVYETFNPGAIDKIELVTTKGKRIDVAIPSDIPTPGASAKRLFEVRCTQEPVRSVRAHLDSQRVAGWNEVDAIGIVPCTR